MPRYYDGYRARMRGDNGGGGGDNSLAKILPLLLLSRPLSDDTTSGQNLSAAIAALPMLTPAANGDANDQINKIKAALKDKADKGVALNQQEKTALLIAAVAGGNGSGGSFGGSNGVILALALSNTL